jgi:uncharacterized protein (DUF305 family)
VILLPLTGCGAASTTDGTGRTAPASASATPLYNATDVMFAQMMVAHHEQGLELVRLAETKAVRDDVRTLAAAIDATETDEAKTMAAWIRNWGQPPSAGPGSHANHGGQPAFGANEVAELKAMSGEEFDRAFLNMFIGHQHGATELARMETGSGVNPGAKALAERIDKSRTAQIAQMLGYLGKP